jgi:peroxiredoxin
LTYDRSGVLPLLVVCALFAAGVGALVAWRAPSDVARIDAPAPEFALANLAGEQVSLSGLRGRVVFVNFWATWCDPCRDEAPSLERLYASFQDEGFELLGVSVDAGGDRDAILDFQEEFALLFPILVDPSKEAYRAYGATGVPESFLIDASGRLVERFIGPRNWDEPRYARALRRLLDAANATRGGEGAGGDD